MKNLIVKSIFILVISFGLFQTSNAAGYYCHARPYYYAPRVYCGPRYLAPVVYRPVVPVIVPGHFIINRYGYRVWVQPHRI
jgi:hypothetical protein